MKKKIIGLFIVIMGIITLTGCSLLPSSTKGGAGNTSSGQVKPKESNLEKKITAKAATTKNGRLIVFLNNGSKSLVSVRVEVEFYDANGTILGSEKEDVEAFEPGAEAVVEIYDTPKGFANYKIYTDAEVSTHVKSYLKDVKISHNKTEDGVAVQVTNNSKDTIQTITTAIVYYQGDTVVGYDYDIASDVKSGRSGNSDFYAPYDNNYEDIPYDNYKVFVNEAFTFDY